MITSTGSFDYIPDNSPFLELFPHRGSYLWAIHPKEGKRPDWMTENRHFLSDRLIAQGAYLYGVRFGKKTSYLMIDIDSRSRYHPSRDPFAVRRILAALEPIGLTRYLAVQSSYSGGVHLYFPFWQPQISHLVGRAAAALLAAQGLTVEAGQLELFPNAKKYSKEFSEFNGHRLPLQAGSYLLDDDWQPVLSSRSLFVERWRAAENDCFQEPLERAIAQYERREWRYLRQPAQKFLNDLNAEIEEGWTSFGQTNRLIGRIALREYVFFHILHGGEPLTGGRLHLRIIEVAIRLPGFRQWCNHTDDLESIAFYWCRSVETSAKYYPYGGKGAKLSGGSVEENWNQQKALDARQRIKAAVDQLLASDSFPVGIKARAIALSKFGVSCATLYKNKDLWHGDIKLEPASDKGLHSLQGGCNPCEPLEPPPDKGLHTQPPISLVSCGDMPPQGADIATDTTHEGGPGGIPQPPPPAGLAHVRAALDSIRRRQVKRLDANDETPPDENWWKELRSQPPPLAGRGKDSTRLQLYLPDEE